MEVTALKHHSDTAKEPNKSWGRRILLVDDQRAVRDAISLLLSLDHHTVVPAGNGVEALELFAEQPFDLVITDFEMPLMRGDELASRIKQTARSQPVLMITAYTERLDESDNPVDAVLTKPFQLEELRQAIASLLSE
jgi:CheY-like chemotaxis protein